MRATIATIFILLISFGALGEDTPVAVIYDKPITIESITPSEEELEKMGIDRRMQGYTIYLDEVRIGRLIKTVIDEATVHFAEENAIEKGSDQALFESFKQAFYSDVPELSDAQIEAASEAVYRWQIDKALYDAFGGTVVFQQTNPQAPIEAYKLFFEQLEKQGHFTINNPKVDTMIKERMGPPYAFVVDPEYVDFSVPWWVKTQ